MSYATILTVLWLATTPPTLTTVPANKPNQTPKVQAAADHNQPGTKASPVFVQVAPADDAKAVAEEKKKEERRDYWDKRMAQATIALAFITAGLAYYTGRLWRDTNRLVKDAEGVSRQQSADMQESLRIAEKSASAAKEHADSTKAMVETMKDTAQRELRAYVGIVSFKWVQRQIKVSYVNGGMTPANRVTGGGWVSTERALTENEIVDHVTNHMNVVGAESDVTLWKDIPTGLLIDVDATGAMQRNTFIHGVIFYEDVFGDSHRVCFQTVMTFNGNWQFTACSQGNRST